MIIGDKFRSQLDFILFETDPHKSASVGQRNSIIWQRSLGEALPSHPDQYAGTDSRFIPKMIRKSRPYFRNIIQLLCLTRRDCEKVSIN